MKLNTQVSTRSILSSLVCAGALLVGTSAFAADDAMNSEHNMSGASKTSVDSATTGDKTDQDSMSEQEYKSGGNDMKSGDSSMNSEQNMSGESKMSNDSATPKPGEATGDPMSGDDYKAGGNKMNTEAGTTDGAGNTAQDK